jgi:hypothetical protein
MDADALLDPLQRVLQQGPDFGHRRHVNLAWLYAQTNEQSSAEQLMGSAIRHVASVHGTPAK